MSSNKINKEVFSKRLKQLLSDNNETIYTLAEIAHLSPATISRYTTGDMSPKITTIESISNYFKVNPVWLMGYDVDKKTIIKDPIDDLSDEEILNLAAHRVGHQGKLSKEELEDINLAIRVALAKHNNI